MLSKIFTLIPLVFIIGCANQIIFLNNEPAPFAYNEICPGGDIRITIRYIYYTEIRENEEFIEWPNYVPLEQPLYFKNKMKRVTYHVNFVNPRRQKIEVTLNEITNNTHTSKLIYKGGLPLQEYNFNIDTEFENKELWIELKNKKENIFCATPRAIWKHEK